MWNLKKHNANGLIYKTETDPHRQKTNLQLPKGEGVGRDTQEFGINRYKLLYKIDKQQGYTLYSTGNYIHYHIINHNGIKKKYTHITASLYCTPETNSTL